MLKVIFVQGKVRDKALEPKKAVSRHFKYRFFGFLGISMPYLVFPSLFLNPAYSILPSDWGNASRAILLGVSLAAYPLGQFFGSPILGSLSDDYGRKRFLIGSLVMTALSNLLTGLAISAHGLGLLIISRFIAGLMEGNIAIARAMVANMKTISKQETFGKINAATSIAYLIGPLLGGMMADPTLQATFTPSTPFYFICFLFFGLSILSGLTIEQEIIHSFDEHRTFWQRINLIQRLRFLFSNSNLRFLLITSTCSTLAVDIFFEFSPVHLTIKWMLPPSQLILYNGALSVAIAIGSGWLLKFLFQRIPNHLILIYTMSGFALFLIGIALTDSSIAMLLLFTLSGFAIGLMETLITVKISNSAFEAIQGEVMGVQISLRV